MSLEVMLIFTSTCIQTNCSHSKRPYLGACTAFKQRMSEYSYQKETDKMVFLKESAFEKLITIYWHQKLWDGCEPSLHLNVYNLTYENVICIYSVCLRIIGNQFAKDMAILRGACHIGVIRYQMYSMLFFSFGINLMAL